MGKKKKKKRDKIVRKTKKSNKNRNLSKLKNDYLENEKILTLMKRKEEENSSSNFTEDSISVSDKL